MITLFACQDYPLQMFGNTMADLHSLDKDLHSALADIKLSML